MGVTSMLLGFGTGCASFKFSVTKNHVLTSPANTGSLHVHNETAGWSRWMTLLLVFLELGIHECLQHRGIHLDRVFLEFVTMKQFLMYSSKIPSAYLMKFGTTNGMA